MHKQVLKAWDDHQEEVRNWIATTNLDDMSYRFLLENTLRILFGEEKYDTHSEEPDYTRIVEVDFGDYQGDLVFVVGGKGYQPSADNHWVTDVSYGSCSGCDTLQGITGYSGGVPSTEQTEGLWTLCLHLMQGMKRLGDLNE